MKAAVFGITAVSLALLTPVVLANGLGCPVDRAISADEALTRVRTWIDAAEYFKRHRVCIDGGLSEAYTQFLAEKLAKPDGPTSLWRETKRQHWFRAVVAKRMESQVIDLETAESIVKNLDSSCPSAAKTYCNDLRTRIQRSCSACTPKK